MYKYWQKKCKTSKWCIQIMHSAPTNAWLIITSVSGNLTAFLASNRWLFIFFVDKICTFLTYFHKKQQKHKVLVNNFQLWFFRKAKYILGYYKTSIHCFNWPLNGYLTYRFMIFRVFFESSMIRIKMVRATP